MNIFKAAELCGLLDSFAEKEQYFRWQVHYFESTKPVDKEELEEAKRLADSAYTLASDLRFLGMFRKAQNTENYLDGRGQSSLPNAPALEAEFRNLREVLLDDVRDHSYLYITEDRVSFVDNPALLGKEVLKAFPSTEHDAREAGNCLAAECNTAGVFHLMRVVELGLRALCLDLGFRNVRAKFKKSGKVVYTPIEYTEWEKLLDALHDRVDAKLQRLKRGNEKKKLQIFYYPALQDIRGIRDAWRNHVMHTRDEYSRKDADAILSHVKRLMHTLSTRISEV